MGRGPELERDMISAEYGQLVEFLGREFAELDRRFDEMDRQIAELRHEMLGHFDEIYRRFERLEQEYQAIIASGASLARLLARPCSS